MNVQLMPPDINTLKAPNKLNEQQVSNKKEDEFSYMLEKSRQKQEKSSKAKQKQKTSIEKVATKAKNSITKETGESQVSTQASTQENQVLIKEKTEKVIKDVAEMLGITVVDLEQMLATLQINISDLLKSDNLQQLVMQVHGTEEPMDLLLIPKVASEIKNVTEAIEKYTANTVISEQETPLNYESEQVGQVQQGQVQPGIKVKEEIRETTGTKRENTDQATKTTVDDITLAVDPSNEKLSQNEEQFTQNQKDSASQFLDNLSQSMGEVFQVQNNQTSETFEEITGRNEVINPRMVLNQIVEKIKVSSLNDEAQMNIQLKPEHLGKLSMEVISKQGIMTAHFTVENEKTKLMLEQNIQSLRESLQDKGLVIQELEVSVGQNQNDDRQTYQNPKSTRNVSEIISSIMNEDLLEKEIKSENLFENDTNEVDFIA